MMELLRQWILGITCASVLLAAAQCLMPAGGARRVGSLAGGLLLLLAVAAPLARLDEGALSLAMTEYRLADTGSAALLELENKRLVKQIIEEQTAAYISDKAEELGAVCAAEVTYDYSGDGVAYPVSVTVRGALTQDQQARLTRLIEAELAVPKENQTYEGVTDQ